MGRLALKILDNELPQGLDIQIEESGEPFDIRLTEDGSLTVENYPVTINGVPVIFKTSYNSKAAFPLFAEIDYTEYEVFDNNGEFLPTFRDEVLEALQG